MDRRNHAARMSCNTSEPCCTGCSSTPSTARTPRRFASTRCCGGDQAEDVAVRVLEPCGLHRAGHVKVALPGHVRNRSARVDFVIFQSLTMASTSSATEVTASPCSSRRTANDRRTAWTSTREGEHFLVLHDLRQPERLLAATSSRCRDFDRNGRNRIVIAEHRGLSLVERCRDIAPRRDGVGTQCQDSSKPLSEERLDRPSSSEPDHHLERIRSARRIRLPVCRPDWRRRPDVSSSIMDGRARSTTAARSTARSRCATGGSAETDRYPAPP